MFCSGTWWQMWVSSRLTAVMGWTCPELQLAPSVYASNQFTHEVAQAQEVITFQATQALLLEHRSTTRRRSSPPSCWMPSGCYRLPFSSIWITSTNRQHSEMLPVRATQTWPPVFAVEELNDWWCLPALALTQTSGEPLFLACSIIDHCWSITFYLYASCHAALWITILKKADKKAIFFWIIFLLIQGKMLWNPLWDKLPLKGNSFFFPGPYFFTNFWCFSTHPVIIGASLKNNKTLTNPDARNVWIVLYK